MLTLDEIQAALEDHTLAEVARQTGLHRNIVGRYARGEIKRGDLLNVRILSEYLRPGTNATPNEGER